MARIAFYLFVKPLSLLPFWMLYGISNIIYLLIYHVIRYRREVVIENISNSFPEQSAQENKKITKGFYKHFADMMVESIKLFSISREKVVLRCKVNNPELVNKFYDSGQHVILVGGHYNNWEMLAVAMNIQIKPTVVGIYAPLSNKFFDKTFANSRTKYGTELVSKRKVKEYFQELETPFKAIVFGSDQSPQHVRENTYWTKFLNQDTPVMFGSEKYATEYNLPVIYFSINKVKRGYYETEFSLITDQPKEMEYTAITETHTRLLEQQIIQKPEFYLWTHKRWKHKPPKGQ